MEKSFFCINRLKNIPALLPEISLNHDSYNRITEISKNIHSSKIKILKLREEIIDTENKLEKIKNEEHHIKDTLKICPLCEKSF